MEISLQVPTLEVNQIAQYWVGQEVYHLIFGLGLRIQIGVDHQQEMKEKEQQVGKVNIAMMQMQHVEPAHYIKDSIVYTKVSVGLSVLNISL